MRLCIAKRLVNRMARRHGPALLLVFVGGIDGKSSPRRLIPKAPKTLSHGNRPSLAEFDDGKLQAVCVSTTFLKKSSSHNLPCYLNHTPASVHRHPNLGNAHPPHQTLMPS